jgi:hypothetical protein
VYYSVYIGFELCVLICWFGEVLPFRNFASQVPVTIPSQCGLNKVYLVDRNLLLSCLIGTELECCIPDVALSPPVKLWGGWEYSRIYQRWVRYHRCIHISTYQLVAHISRWPHTIDSQIFFSQYLCTSLYIDMAAQGYTHDPPPSLWRGLSIHRFNPQTTLWAIRQSEWEARYIHPSWTRIDGN